MSQPRKPGSSSRKPAARTGAAGGKRPPAGRASAGGSRAAGSTPAGDEPSRADRRREDQLQAAIGGVRDLLGRGVVLTAERLQEIVDEAVRRGQMTRQDAEDLVTSIVSVGRRQAQDALSELESAVGRSARETGRQAGARIKGVGAVARRAPGGDRALRTVDRVRRAAGIGVSFPIRGYDDLTTGQVKERLAGLTDAELRKVRDHERRNANRKQVLTAIEKRLDA